MSKWAHKKLEHKWKEKCISELFGGFCSDGRMGAGESSVREKNIWGDYLKCLYTEYYGI